MSLNTTPVAPLSLVSTLVLSSPVRIVPPCASPTNWSCDFASNCCWCHTPAPSTKTVPSGFPSIAACRLSPALSLTTRQPPAARHGGAGATIAATARSADSGIPRLPHPRDTAHRRAAARRTEAAAENRRDEGGSKKEQRHLDLLHDRVERDVEREDGVEDENRVKEQRLGGHAGRRGARRRSAAEQRQSDEEAREQGIADQPALIEDDQEIGMDRLLAVLVPCQVFLRRDVDAAEESLADEDRVARHRVAQRFEDAEPEGVVALRVAPVLLHVGLDREDRLGELGAAEHREIADDQENDRQMADPPEQPQPPHAEGEDAEDREGAREGERRARPQCEARKDEGEGGGKREGLAAQPRQHEEEYEDEGALVRRSDIGVERTR